VARNLGTLAFERRCLAALDSKPRVKTDTTAALQLAAGSGHTNRRTASMHRDASIVGTTGIYLGHFQPRENNRRLPSTHTALNQTTVMMLTMDLDETPAGAPPKLGTREFSESTVAVAVSELAAFASKNPKTMTLYRNRWAFFVQVFCEDSNFKYNPWLVDYVPELFTQFAAWMLTRGKNLTIAGFAAAFNTIYALKGLPLAWRGGTVTEVIRCYRDAMIVRSRGQGRQIAALRVMFTTPALIRMLTLAERFYEAKEYRLLVRMGIVIQMFRNLLRANSASGFRKGDNKVNEEGFIGITVRKVKWGRAHIKPFVKSTPPPRADNVVATRIQTILVKIIKACEDTEVELTFSAQFAGFEGDKAAAEITAFIQTHLPNEECGVAEGSFNSSHSARITGANHALFSAKGDTTVVQRWGGWKSRLAMEAYVDLDTLPCPVWRDVFYWLQYGYSMYSFESGPAGYDTSTAI
jgi:hypothetical protein